ncbi:unnamed protein product [Peronospora belbahrii]|uniref:Uncharacterized protein n=1 Tax=Peronospora belbahrii TaxID=622444 RepID=A0AAU9KR18_9STRA|nr:unnamed protein product [Peronospora belbahrii]
MEMTSSVMRFALATYFMKRGCDSYRLQASNVAWSSTTHEPIRVECDAIEIESSQEFSNIVSTHVLKLRQLLVDQRLQDWSRGVLELRDYVTTNGLVTSLMTLLFKLLERQEQDAVCIVQIIEHMCFEKKGEPSQVFDQFVELLFTALARSCVNKNVSVAIWILRAIHGIIHGLHQYHEQQYETITQHQFARPKRDN